MGVIYLLYLYYCPTFSEPTPAWLNWLAILALFIYQTMDAIDGKQARRTGTSSPLGELFDHGCDALTTIFVAMSTAASVQLGANTHLLLPMLGVLVPFFLTQWEEYFSGILELGYVSVTEGQVGVMGVFALTALFGMHHAQHLFCHNTIQNI
jgi:phosphatidylglycerophosphate synthase